MKISIKVKTKSSQEKVEKSGEGYIVHVKEPPVENRANSHITQIIYRLLR